MPDNRAVHAWVETNPSLTLTLTLTTFTLTIDLNLTLKLWYLIAHSEGSVIHEHCFLSQL